MAEIECMGGPLDGTMVSDRKGMFWREIARVAEAEDPLYEQREIRPGRAGMYVLTTMGGKTFFWWEPDPI